jgi:hypothetical protein
MLLYSTDVLRCRTRSISGIMKKYKMWIVFALALCVTYVLANDANSLAHGFSPVIVSPLRYITYTSISPGKLFRVIIVYEKIGDVNYSVLLQKRFSFSTKLIYESPDLDKPLFTERVVWSNNAARVQLVSRNSGFYSGYESPPERRLWCYETAVEKLKSDCD